MSASLPNSRMLWTCEHLIHRYLKYILSSGVLRFTQETTDQSKKSSDQREQYTDIVLRRKQLIKIVSKIILIQKILYYKINACNPYGPTYTTIRGN